jgi:hypothetical protein
LFNVHGVSNVRQTDIHTAEPLVPEQSVYEVEIPIEKLKRDKSRGTDQIPAKLLMQSVEKFAVRSINLLILFGMRKKCLRSVRSPSLYLSIRREMKETVVIIEAYIGQLRTKFYSHSDVKFNSLCRENDWVSSVWISTPQADY